MSEYVHLYPGTVRRPRTVYDEEPVVEVFFREASGMAVPDNSWAGLVLRERERDVTIAINDRLTAELLREKLDEIVEWFAARNGD